MSQKRCLEFKKELIFSDIQCSYIISKTTNSQLIPILTPEIFSNYFNTHYFIKIEEQFIIIFMINNSNSLTKISKLSHSMSNCQNIKSILLNESLFIISETNHFYIINIKDGKTKDLGEFNHDLIPISSHLTPIISLQDNKLNVITNGNIYKLKWNLNKSSFNIINNNNNMQSKCSGITFTEQIKCMSSKDRLIICESNSKCINIKSCQKSLFDVSYSFDYIQFPNYFKDYNYLSPKHDDIYIFGFNDDIFLYIDGCHLFVSFFQFNDNEEFPIIKQIFNFINFKQISKHLDFVSDIILFPNGYLLFIQNHKKIITTINDSDDDWDSDETSYIFKEGKILSVDFYNLLPKQIITHYNNQNKLSLYGWIKRDVQITKMNIPIYLLNIIAIWIPYHNFMLPQQQSDSYSI